MEKYRKFDDPRHGINPFNPLPEAHRPILYLVPRYVRTLPLLLLKLFGVFLFLVKMPVLAFVLFFALVASFAKNLLVIPALIRPLERFLNYMFFRTLITQFGANKCTLRYHGQHKDFNYLEFSQGRNVPNHSKYIREGEKTIILSNEASLLDYLYLCSSFSPDFVQIDLLGNDQMGLRILGRWELLKKAIGVTLPQPRHDLFTSFEDLLASQAIKRPLVVFPQCARTNGRGVLDFPASVVAML